ncbi:MAG: exodeoxyribonuclease VII small subunit [Oscillospiraceae bacterium]|nr:exodeoxyribonuclease VII small subunit [Oscillospiraceae bacterium]
MTEEKSFEDNMAELEKILETLQDENTGLERSVSLYREAAGLLETCNQKLSEAKVQIEEISVKMQKAEDFHAK